MDVDSNGNGILSKFGKYSWSLALIAMIGGPISSYFMLRQEVTVGLASLDLRLAALEARSDKDEKRLDETVPKEVHETRWKMQEEIDKLREQLEIERYQRLKEEIELHK